ncbi:MAG TPA: hypothetical protein VHV08_05145 [Pirellulales bacterium]|nr:hypothetical protein [Pirellulales bacterium]
MTERLLAAETVDRAVSQDTRSNGGAETAMQGPPLPPSPPSLPPPLAIPLPPAPPTAVDPPLPLIPPDAAGPPPPDRVEATVVSPIAAKPPVDAAVEPLELVEPTWHEIWLQVPSWLTSMVVHLSLVLFLALLATSKIVTAPQSDITVSTQHDGVSGEDELQGDMAQSTAGLEQPDAPALSPPQLSDLAASAPLSDTIGPLKAELLKPEVALPGIAGGPDIEGATGGGSGAPGTGGIGDGLGNSLELRLSGSHRAGLLHSGGGTPHSEKAVALALHWLAEHQNYDGSWTFEHQKSPKCHGSCDNPGYTPGKIAATSLALLPFLGTGQTHREGEYRRQIDLGLKFLTRSMVMEGTLGSMFDEGGQMYGHGLASIVLCEAYGMTHDLALQVPAQGAVNFIVQAQDPVGGGWRYIPRQPGDTSVLGWQLMALKSAQMAYNLKVPQTTTRRAEYFLDYVQSERGAFYGYTRPESRRPATTAIGLLCRMYLGWKHDTQPLQRGVQALSQLGPSTDVTTIKNDMYYNYYATQVMHHYGGYPWQRWNEVLREYLIKSQAKRGHETGSWFFEGNDHGAPAGGRLYCTAMAAMTLEVYYRYMPLYREQSTKQ